MPTIVITIDATIAIEIPPIKDNLAKSGRFNAIVIDPVSSNATDDRSELSLKR